MLATCEMTERLEELAGSSQPEDQALSLLVSRAIRRGDTKMARDLIAVPARSGEDYCAMVPADCPVLARIGTICDPIETLAWRRAVVVAGVRDDRRRVRALLDIAARRCPN